MTCLDPVDNECVSTISNICNDSTALSKTWPTLPSWAKESERKKWGEKLEIKEWDGPNEDDNDHDVQKYRAEHGWNVRCLLCF
jgi:hypothetical protein